METKNVIGIVKDNHNYEFFIADCATGNVLHQFPFYQQPLLDRIDIKIPVAKIEIEWRENRNALLRGKPIKEYTHLDWGKNVIDNGGFDSRSTSVDWLERTVKIYQNPKNEDRCKVRFVKGSLKSLKMIAEKYNTEKRCSWREDKVRGERFLNKTSYYNENETIVRETLIFYYHEEKKVYRRHGDWFAVQCMKLGLDFNKYSNPKCEYRHPEDVLREIVKDLGYNLLAII